MVWKVSLLQSPFASVAFASTPGLFQGLNLIIEARLDGKLLFKGTEPAPSLSQLTLFLVTLTS